MFSTIMPFDNNGGLGRFIGDEEGLSACLFLLKDCIFNMLRVL